VLGKVQTAASLELQKEKTAGAALESESRTCMQSATTKDTRTACATGAPAKAALEKSLGRSVTQTEVNQANDKSAKESVMNAMSTCMTNSTTADERFDCKNVTVRGALANAVGKTEAELSLGDIDYYLQRGAKDKMGATMSACMEVAGGDNAKMTACKQDTAKEALATARGKKSSEVSGTELTKYLKEGTEAQVREKMKACVTTATGKSAKAACSQSAGRSAIAAGLGKREADVSKRDVLSYQKKAGEAGMVSMMKQCMETAGTDTAKMTTCKTNAKATLGESLGKESTDIDATDFEMSLKKGAEVTMAIDMRTCMSTAKSSAERKACSEAARANMARMMGKSSLSAPDFQVVQKQAASKNLRSNMMACVEASGSNATQMGECKTKEGKKSLAASLGKRESEVTTAALEQFVRRGAADGLGDTIATCMESAAGNTTEMALCRGTVGKQALAASLGKAVSAISDLQMKEYMNKGAKKKAGSTMDACMQGVTTSNQRRTCFTGAGKTNIANALGKPASEVTDTFVRGILMDSAKDKITELMKACVSEATDTTERKACGKGSKMRASLASSLGKPVEEVDQTDLEVYKRKGAQDGVKNAMQACMADVKTSASRKDCKDTVAKAALAEATGKVSSEIDSTDVEIVVQEGARSAVVDTMKACMELAKGKTDQAERKTARKGCSAQVQLALAETLGKETVDAASAGDMIRQASKRDQAEKMSACVQEAAADATKLTACRGSVAKANLADNLGKDPSEVTPGDVEESIREATKFQVGTTVEACVAAAGGVQVTREACTKDTTTRRGKRDSSAKRAVKETTGKTSVSDTETQAFVRSGATDKVAQVQQACMTSAGSDDAKIALCDPKGKQEVANALGRNSTDIDDNMYREWKRKSALDRTEESMLGCLSVATDATAKSNCLGVTVKKAAEEAMGKKPGSLDTADVMDFVIEAAANGAVKKNKACIAAAESKPERVLCRNTTKASLSQLMGDPVTPIKEVDFDRMLDKGMGDDMANLAAACKAAADGSCGFRAAREEAKGPDADDSSKVGRPEYKVKAEDGEAKRQGAKALVRQARRACKASTTGTNKEILACIKKSAADNGINQTGTGAFTRIEADADADAKEELRTLYRAAKESGSTDAQALTKAKARMTQDEKPLAVGETKESCGNPPCKGSDKDEFLARVKQRGAANSRKGVKDCVEAKVTKQSKKQPAAQATCDAEADADAAKAFGGKRKDRRGEKDLAAELEAGEMMMACLDEGGTAGECDSMAEDRFLKEKGGVAVPGSEDGAVQEDTKAALKAEFVAKKARIQKLVAAKRAGAKTVLVKKKQADVEIDFPVPCSTVDDAATLTQVRTSMVISASAAGISRRALATAATTQEAKMSPTASSCTVRYKVALTGQTDAKIEALTTDFAAKTIQGTTKRRAGSFTGTSYASQTTEVETYGTSVPSPSPGTNPTPGTGPTPTGLMTIKQTIAFTSLTATEYNMGTAVKQVAETAYAIGLGIYNTTAKALQQNCAVSSSASRRATTVAFEASVSAALSASAQSSAEGLSASLVATHMQTAQSTLGTSVTLPTVGTVGAASTATSTTPTPTPVASGSSDSLSMMPIIVGGAIVFVVGMAVAIYYVFGGASSEPRVVAAVNLPLGVTPQAPAGAVYQKNGVWLSDDGKEVC